MAHDPTTRRALEAAGKGARIGPAPRERVRHMAHAVDMDGRVSALCFTRMRPINMRVATWTNRKEAVTCPKCMRVILAAVERAAKEGT